MSKIDDNVIGLLKNAKVWHIATMGDKPNVVPVLFKTVDEDNHLVLFDVFMKKTINNINKNSKVAVTVYDIETLQGFQLKGTAKYNDDPVFIEEGNKVTKNFNMITKGSIIINVNEITVLTPGPDNGKIL